MISDRAYSRFTTTIPDWMLRLLGKWNVPIYRATRGRLLGHVGKSPVLLLTTTGRKSGQPRTAPVLYMADGDRLVVIGSNAGNVKPPAWALNLVAKPDALVEVGADRRRVRARVAEGDEREDLWRRANEQYEGFDDYKQRTERDVRLFVLEPA
jgi:deazaflavin-dependent oxidoreductase (nitroreductase family)